MMTQARERQLLLSAGEAIVQGLGRMLAPCFEVVLHDLTTPAEAIVAIENPISGRSVGDSTTELGLRRVSDPDCPQIVQNYASHFSDGRPAKSTSIGLKDSNGRYIASICLNLDVSALGSALRHLNALIAIDDQTGVGETLRSRSVDEVREALERYAARLSVDVRALSSRQRQGAIQLLSDRGLLRLRGSAAEAARTLGISRGAVYNALRRHTAQAASA